MGVCRPHRWAKPSKKKKIGGFAHRGGRTTPMALGGVAMGVVRTPPRAKTNFFFLFFLNCIILLFLYNFLKIFFFNFLFF
jgi:hypothetical protein